jgi:hypothetical protein
MELFDNDELNKGSELEAEEQKQVEQEQQATPEPEAPKVPDKYRGKSLEDIVAMHQEAEKLIGRQAQEVGEVRKLADELLKQQLASKQQLPPQEENEVDFFENPQKAVQKAVENHPDVLAAKQAAMQLKQIKAQAALNQAHPDFADVVQDPEFVNWVKGSPYRLNMYAMANAQYDFAAANELLSTFKQIRGTKTKETVDTGKKVLESNLKAAAVDVGGTGESSKKIYRRADLIRLRMTDPARYEALQPEIMQAYSDGRVK